MFILVLLSFGVGLYFYPRLPQEAASHWNARGEVDSYISKFWGAFLMPIISVAVLLLLMIVPRVDPKRENIEKFRKYFDWFIILLILFLLYIYCLSLAWNLGVRFDFIQILSPAFAILFYYVGILVSHAEPNWTIGIRTPWTLSSDVVWQKTHELGGRLFKVAGILSLGGILLPDFAIWLILVPVLAVVIITIVYSYQQYQQEQEKSNPKI